MINSTNTTNTTLANIPDHKKFHIEWWRITAVVVMLFVSGLFAGLNLGVNGLDPKTLELMIQGPFENEQEEKEAKYAKKILPLRKRGNLLLCTILIGNIVINTGISILIESVFTGYIALIVSSLLITIISEIIPQSFMSRYGLAAGAHLSWFMYLAMGVFFIVAYPIAAILDKILGEEVGMSMNKGMMKKFFHMQQEQGELT